MALNAKLVVVGGEVKTAEIKLRLPSTIGRGRGTSIMLPHPLVSRQHCELFEANGKLMVRDLGSLNGTFVNNQRITESIIEPGELLTIGAVTFRAAYELTDVGPPADYVAPGTGDTNISPGTAGLDTTIPAGEIVDVEVEIEELDETSSVSEPMSGAGRTDATIEEVMDIDAIEEVVDGGSTQMGSDDLRATLPAPAGNPSANGAPSPNGAPGYPQGVTSPVDDEAAEDEDDLQDFLNSLK